MTFYTADLHLGHANIIRHCGRPFSSAGEMDEALIRNWNRVVGEEDLVCILGDLICYSKRRPEEYLARLRGRKLLVVGNHDDAWMQQVELLDYFQAVVDQTVVRDDSGALVHLCHYPQLDRSGRRADYFIHGHIHNNTHMDTWPAIRACPVLLNAGVEINGYAPATLGELVHANRAFQTPCQTGSHLIY